MNPMRLPLSVLTVGLFLAAASPAQKPQRIFDVKSLLGKGFDGYSWALGKARSIAKEPHYGETRIFVGPIDEITKVYVTQRESSAFPDQIEVLFKADQAKDWQSALKLLGFAPEGATAKPKLPVPSGGSQTFSIVGIKKSKAEFIWAPENSEFKAPTMTVLIPKKS